jgi:hypothetical protein
MAISPANVERERLGRSLFWEIKALLRHAEKLFSRALASAF